MSKRLPIALAALLGALALCLAIPLAASAASPWWQILDGSHPSNLWKPVDNVKESGRLVVTVTNLGNEDADGSADPVRILDKLPEGVIASSAEGFAGAKDEDGPVSCEVQAGGKEVLCTWEGEELPAYESIEIEIPVSLQGDPPVAGESGEITVTGGGAAEKIASQEINVSPEAVPFGIERFSAVAEEEGGARSSQAGRHPFQFTTTLQFNSGWFQPGPDRLNSSVEQPAQPRNFRFTLPAGLIGNIRTVPRCPLADFDDGSRILTNQCPDETAVGVAATTIVEKSVVKFTRLGVPLFNLVPDAGEPARLGLTAGGASVVIDTEVDPENEYRIIGVVRNATQLAEILSSTVTIWGTPGDPSHDAQRGWVCGFHLGEPLGECEDPPGANEDAFLRLPVNCSAPSVTGTEVEPWNVPLKSVVASEVFATPPLGGCAAVPFEPGISAAPTNKHAGAPSGLDVELKMPNKGLLKKDAISEGQAKKVEVTLPEGVTINPSQAEGLAACSLEQFEAETASSPAGAGCPEAAKVGSVAVKTPILEEEVKGSVYVATPYDNPFGSLVALYIVAKAPERGIVVKQAGKVDLNPQTGQLVSTFDNLPQVPFETFNLHFNEGNRAPLVMPEKCGTYDMVTKFTPWSAEDPNNPTPAEVVTETSPFTIDQGCPSGPPPFNPSFLAGTSNNSAGTYSPFNIRLTRQDNEQEFSRFSVKLPKGVIGKLSGIPFCPDAAIAAATARTGPNGGQEELTNPSCPAASQIGRTLVGAGVGPELTYVPGKVYLAGPYKGAKLSIVAITAGKAGPFDLGTVVIRQALRINPETAEVTSDGSSADPIPHILKGVVVHARDIRVYVDRENFVLNPTNCERMSAAASVQSTSGQSANVSSPFQAADCASLGLKPKLSIQLMGGTKRTATPRLKAVLTARKGDANIGRAQVTLPKSEFLEQAHIRTVCTRVQFNAGAGNGEQCPKGSVYGKAKATSPLLDETLSGPVYLRSSEHELPDLVAALHSPKVDIDLVGRIDSVGGGIRTTFEGVPDAPVTKFTLEMQGGKKGLIVNSTNICKGKHHATAKLKGQNGRLYEFNPVVKAKCGGKKKGKGGGGK
jgi:hypothetical protein